MKILIRLFLGITALLLCAGVISRAGQNTTSRKQPSQPQRDYPVKPVPFTAVHLNDKFWAPRIEINRTVTIPFAFQKCEETGRVDNFDRAAAALKGELKDKKLPPYPFDDWEAYHLSIELRSLS